MRAVEVSDVGEPSWFAQLPESLLTAVLGQQPTQNRRLDDLLLRIGLWFRVVDYIVIGPGKARITSKLDPQRYSVLQSSGDKTLTILLQKRLSTHHRSVLWVDPNLTAGSPSMRSLVNSVNTLSANGWSVRGLTNISTSTVLNPGVVTFSSAGADP